MKKIIFWIIVILVIYYYRNTIINWPIVQAILQNPIVANVVNKAENHVEETVNAEMVLQEIKTWVLKDGVSLPKDWTLAEKTFGTQKVTVMIPPNPQGENDFIVLNLKKENVPLLPKDHICKSTEVTETPVTCLIGNNYNTLKVFSIVTFTNQ